MGGFQEKVFAPPMAREATSRRPELFEACCKLGVDPG
jgi:hypothetical protein